MKCVFTVAGLGTRLLPLTKELPKEMIPIFDLTNNGELVIKPFLQLIFEKLYDYNVRDFCFIVGRTKRAVQEHFTPDFDLVNQLKGAQKTKIAKILNEFFKKLENSNIVFIYQPKPIGFGDAIYRSKKFVGDESFILHAGDDIVLSKQNSHLKRLTKAFKKHNADFACLIEKVADPKHYGVVDGSMLEPGVMKIEKSIEKSKKTKYSTAIIAIYMFKPTVFKFLEMAKDPKDSEKQLARAWNIAIKKKAKIIGVMLNSNEKRIDTGTPESYAKMLLDYLKILKNGKKFV